MSLSYVPLSYLPSALWAQLWPLPYPAADFTGKTVIVTGASGGLGLEAARHFARLGAARVILGCRDAGRGEAARRDAEAAAAAAGAGGVAEAWPVDLESFESVRRFCGRARGLRRLDAVVENAASLTVGAAPAAEGYDPNITVNVISTYLMALLLLPKLRETAVRFNVTPHLSIVSSDGHIFAGFPERHEPCIFEAFKSRERLMGDRYLTSKLLVVLVARELARALSARGGGGGGGNDVQVVVNTVNPGVCRTRLFRAVPFPLGPLVAAGLVLGRTCEMGSRTLVAAATAGPDSHGRYMDSCRVWREGPFVTSAEGAAAQRRVYAELMALLEEIEPGITADVQTKNV